MAPLLVMLHEALGADVDLYLMPALDVSEMPIKSYYRFVEPVLAGAESPAAVFENLPTQHILTMKVCVRASIRVGGIGGHCVCPFRCKSRSRGMCRLR